MLIGPTFGGYLYELGGCASSAPGPSALTTGVCSSRLPTIHPHTHTPRCRSPPTDSACVADRYVPHVAVYSFPLPFVICSSFFVLFGIGYPLLVGTESLKLSMKPPADITTLLAVPPYWWFLLMGFLSTLAATSLEPILAPFLMQPPFLLTPGKIGMISALFAIAGMTGAIFSGFLLPYLGAFPQLWCHHAPPSTPAPRAPLSRIHPSHRTHHVSSSPIRTHATSGHKTSAHSPSDRRLTFAIARHPQHILVLVFRLRIRHRPDAPG